MKSIIYILLGIILGIITIRLALAAIIALCNLMLFSALIDGLFAWGIGILAGKCFNKA